MCNGNCKQCLLSETECYDVLIEMQEQDDDAIREVEFEDSTNNEW